MSKFRGNEIYKKESNWYYIDSNELVKNKYNQKPCGKCNMMHTKEGHDACLETLPGLMNACCGHGNNEEAYVQFLDKTIISGDDAIVIINILKNK